MQRPQISTITSGSNTLSPLADDGLCDSASNLAILNDLLVTHLSHISTTSIQEHYQAFEKSVAIAQHLLENHGLIATDVVVDHDHLRQHRDQQRIA
jgi:hypothetical protein